MLLTALSGDISLTFIFSNPTFWFSSIFIFHQQVITTAGPSSISAFLKSINAATSQKYCRCVESYRLKSSLVSKLRRWSSTINTVLARFDTHSTTTMTKDYYELDPDGDVTFVFTRTDRDTANQSGLVYDSMFTASCWTGKVSIHQEDLINLWMLMFGGIAPLGTEHRPWYIPWGRIIDELCVWIWQEVKKVIVRFSGFRVHATSRTSLYGTNFGRRKPHHIR
jgi:hypothetical protein